MKFVPSKLRFGPKVWLLQFHSEYELPTAKGVFMNKSDAILLADKSFGSPLAWKHDANEFSSADIPREIQSKDDPQYEFATLEFVQSFSGWEGEWHDTTQGEE